MKHIITLIAIIITGCTQCIAQPSAVKTLQISIQAHYI